MPPDRHPKQVRQLPQTTSQRTWHGGQRLPSLCNRILQTSPMQPGIQLQVFPNHRPNHMENFFRSEPRTGPYNQTQAMTATQRTHTQPSPPPSGATHTAHNTPPEGTSTTQQRVSHRGQAPDTTLRDHTVCHNTHSLILTTITEILGGHLAHFKPPWKGTFLLHNPVPSSNINHRYSHRHSHSPSTDPPQPTMLAPSPPPVQPGLTNPLTGPSQAPLL